MYPEVMEDNGSIFKEQEGSRGRILGLTSYTNLKDTWAS